MEDTCWVSPSVGSNAPLRKLHQTAGIHPVGCAEGNVALQAKPTKTKQLSA